MANAENSKRNYHHGDLRAALIEAGLKLLAEREADDIGLREVARSVGVSATAVYRHFPDKGALLKALAREGLAQLGAAQRAAGEAAGGGVAGFNAMGRAYVRFALVNPALFRLIFKAGPGTHPEAWDRSPDEAMALLLENASRLAPDGPGGAAGKLFALRAWSLVHGLSVLLLDGLVAVDDKTIDALIDAHDSPIGSAV